MGTLALATHWAIFPRSLRAIMLSDVKASSAVRSPEFGRNTIGMSRESHSWTKWAEDRFEIKNTSLCMCNVQFYLRPLMYLLFGLLKHRWVLLRLRLPQCRRFFHAGTQIHKGDPGRSGIWTLESGCRRGFELKLAAGLPSTEDHSYHRSSQARLCQTRAPQHFWSRRDTHWLSLAVALLVKNTELPNALLWHSRVSLWCLN